MIQRLLIAALTVLVFGAGYMVRGWAERDSPVPPPPPALGSEFTRATPAPAVDPKGAPGRGGHDFDSPVDRGALVAEIEKARPQIDLYRKRLDELDAEFDHELLGLLTSDQREKFVARQKRNEERRTTYEAREAADTTPLSDERILRLQQIPLFNALWTITISARLDRLNSDLKFDDAQQAKVRELLLARREKFLALVDSAPPPTITLSLLAPHTEKLEKRPSPANEPPGLTDGRRAA